MTAPVISDAAVTAAVPLDDVVVDGSTNPNVALDVSVEIVQVAS